MTIDHTMPTLITEDLLAELPAPVQRYMRWTGLIGRPWLDSALISQTGRFRLSADRDWMPMTAEQTFTTRPPGFQWNARFKMFGLPLLSARDTYREGQGHMFGKMAGLITVFDDKTEKLTLGAMTRYLSELIWLPAAYLHPFITWEAVDEQTAEVHFTDAGRTVSGTMHFDDEGRPLTFRSDRYYEKDGDYELVPWSTPTTSYGVRDGLNIPVQGKAMWHLPSGDLPYVEVSIPSVIYTWHDHPQSS